MQKLLLVMKKFFNLIISLVTPRKETKDNFTMSREAIDIVEKALKEGRLSEAEEILDLLTNEER
jgi:hypothetical protein